jgi:acyl-CoA:6-aminopenicillanic acid acyl transferase
MEKEHTNNPANKKSRLKHLFSTRNRTMVLAGICGILLAFCIVPGGIQLFRNTIYSILPTGPTTLNLPSAPYENGKKHGEECKFSINLLCDIYLKRIVCHNSDKRLKDGSAVAEKLFASINQRWTEEINGLSEGCGVEKGELMLANSFLDIGLARIGCRQIVLNAKGIDKKQPQRLMHAHNLDWDNLGGVGNFLVTIFRTKGSSKRFATVRMGFPGMLGALTIINGKGISLGFDQLGSARGETKMPIFIQMRNIAETCSTFEKANKMLMDMPEGMPFCIVMADAKTGQAAVYERLLKNHGQAPTLTSGTESKVLIPIPTPIFRRNIKNGVLTADNASWCGNDMSLCTVDNVAREYCSKTCNLKLMKSILRDNRVLLGCNIYSVIFDYNKNTFYLASGKIPAAKGKYREFTLFEKEKMK